MRLSESEDVYIGLTGGEPKETWSIQRTSFHSEWLFFRVLVGECVRRPVKKLLPDYSKFEEELQKTIYNAFGLDSLTTTECQFVQEIDDAMLSYEMKVLLDNPGINDLALVHEHDLSFIPMEDIEKEFIETFESLSGNL